MQKKQKIIIFITVLLLLFLITGVFIFYKKMKVNQPSGEQIDIPQAEKKKLDDYELGKKARKENNIEYCYQLKSDDPDECIYIAASYNQDRELCDKIQDEDIKKECHEYFIYQEIISGKTVKDCQLLEISKFNQQCLTSFFGKWDDVKKCAEFEDENKILCEDIINKKTAYKNSNIELCDSIKNSALSADCEKIIINKPKDSDNDGLLDSEERSYGTNPFEADSDFDGLSDLEEISKYFTDPNDSDSDNDGYSDGDEVKNNYNPLME